MRPFAAVVAALAIRCRPIPPLLLLVLGTAPLNAAAVTRVDGDVFDADQGTLRYRESHWLLDDGGRLVLYHCPNGQPFARKQVEGGGTSPDFSLLDGRDGYREGVRKRNGVREMFQQQPGKPERSTALPEGKDERVIDAGFDAYLRNHWDALASASQRVDFVLPSLQRQLGFRVERIDDNAGQRRFRISLDAWYGAAVPALEVRYSIANKRLLEFRGVGNLRDPQGRYPRVRIVFPDSDARPATAEELRQAREQPLTRSCSAS
ncbi:hypothetical protein BJD12_20330 [Xanthomonas vesicatoria ATCC 35937]|uniref:Uncharacterized protein n=1 Tax=Xanthomonas vesicatoria ATCC 35937 TaxID=925775 RepID=F0BF34_9XANT|nr:hypothetical protein [Xanthomonas vesicatoria]APP77181.1 hypothetical protein BJD12_20330 [Xanthomonas vesicatoria ATCC 35937]EGD08892.1 hypothetical protein XVE_2814 [Xanthomonas vesicatoria ATCC 35937]KTF32361.1 hypothetical protein LMG920_13325 [Xanthomonas vesicatoria]MCC8597440.1 hypothetical protein [Xanthomonas vesicatoria]MCC8606404.1 hypothetical protein [Xanthomonas vesicatoria]